MSKLGEALALGAAAVGGWLLLRKPVEPTAPDRGEGGGGEAGTQANDVPWEVVRLAFIDGEKMFLDKFGLPGEVWHEGVSPPGGKIVVAVFTQGGGKLDPSAVVRTWGPGPVEALPGYEWIAWREAY